MQRPTISPTKIFRSLVETTGGFVNYRASSDLATVSVQPCAARLSPSCQSEIRASPVTSTPAFTTWICMRAPVTSSCTWLTSERRSRRLASRTPMSSRRGGLSLSVSGLVIVYVSSQQRRLSGRRHPRRGQPLCDCRMSMPPRK